MRHPEFEKILAAFKVQYGAVEGAKQYERWLKVMDLDESQPYLKSRRRENFKESVDERFSWITPHIQYIREDKEAKWYKVEALFPLTSMNGNKYTREELAAATRTMIGKLNNLNHTDERLDFIEIKDAQFEDDAVELLVRILKSGECSAGNLCNLIDNAENEAKGIVNVSIEAEGLRGGTQQNDGSNRVEGLIFTGLAWLTKDVLAGVPLTRIRPVEALQKNTETEQGATMPETDQKIEALTKQVESLEDKLKKFEEFNFAKFAADVNTALGDINAKIAAIAPPAQIQTTPTDPATTPDPEAKSKDKEKTDGETKPDGEQKANSELQSDAASEKAPEVDVSTIAGYNKRLEQLRTDGLPLREALQKLNMEFLEKFAKK